MAADPLIGLELGDYLVEQVIASGGMGLVYRARHPLLKRAVAVKVLREKYAEDAEQMQRFLKEAQLLSALRHDGIVDVINFGNLPDGRQYMMMELLSGETLAKVLKREGKLPVARALALTDQLLDALAVAHQAGVVHRDLKPSNIFLVPQSNGTERLKLLDFGIAQKLAPEEKYDPKKKASIVGGTPQYVSPEQAEGLVATPSSDLYSVGGVLFHMLSGRVAFVGDESVLLLRAQVSVPAPALASVMPEVSPELNALVAQLLEKKPSRRAQSAELVRRELARIRERLPAGPVAARRSENSRRVVLGFVGLVAAGGLASFIALQSLEEVPVAPVSPAPLAPVVVKPVAAVNDVKPEPPPALDEAEYKKAMAAALEREAAMEAQHRDRELVMGRLFPRDLERLEQHLRPQPSVRTARGLSQFSLKVTFFVVLRQYRVSPLHAADYILRLAESGRHHFTTAEAAAELGGSLPATRAALRRLKAKGEITDPSRGFYLIVPPEYRRLGSLPADQFIAQLMQHLGEPYYVALLSAAELHGAAHQRPQAFQVMAKANRRPIRSGEVRVQFIARKDLEQTPVIEKRTPRGLIRVASPEATALELVGYADQSGGLDNVASVLIELVEHIDPNKLLLEAARSPIVWSQRLGYVLDLIDHRQLSDQILPHVSARAKAVAPLVRAKTRAGAKRNSRWKLAVNADVEPDL